MTATFPTIPGYPAFPIGKIANWSTRMQRSVSGRTLRSSDYINPIWNFTLIYPGLHDYPFCAPPPPAPVLPTEFRTLLSFFNDRQGAFDSFLFEDFTDDVAVGQLAIPVPTDLTGTMFQLTRQLAPGGRSEWITAPGVLRQVYINGTPTVGSFTLDSTTGILAFSSPPGGVVTADFGLYFPVSFT